MKWWRSRKSPPPDLTSIFDRIEAIRLEPGDVLVVKAAFPINEAVAARLKASLTDALGAKYKILVFDRSIDLAVLRAANFRELAKA